MFVDAAHQDYRLRDDARRTPFQKPMATTYRQLGLLLQAEYVHPRSVRPLSAPPLYPGAVQSLLR